MVYLLNYYYIDSYQEFFLIKPRLRVIFLRKVRGKRREHRGGKEKGFLQNADFSFVIYCKVFAKEREIRKNKRERE